MNRICASAVLFLLLSASSTPAEDTKTCRLPEIGSLDMTTEIDGRVSVPVALDGVKGLWTVDTGNIVSMIGDTLAAQLKLDREPNMRPGILMGGIAIAEVARVHSIDFAGMHGGEALLNVAPEAVLAADTIGMLAPDIMKNYDVEFDFAAGKLNVFTPNTCPGGVVYWTKSAFAQVPMKLDEAGHITVPVMLDGKPLMAIVDTGAEGSVISLATLHAALGIDETNPALKPTGKIAINGMASSETYHYPFASLTFEGVQVGNPHITILKSTGMGKAGPELLLGIETLRQLHLYIAYQEGNIYLTPAEAR